MQDAISIITQLVNKKQQISFDQLDQNGLNNSFRIGSCAGGARSKILISEHKETGKIIPGDLEYGEKYNHYPIKLSLPEEHFTYRRKVVEYTYYQSAIMLGIEMKPSHLIDGKHLQP